MENETKFVIKGGRVIDPANDIDEVLDVYVEDGMISRIGGKKNYQDRAVIDATGKLVMPGLVDIHTHLREPGREDAETIQTGSLSAVRGGITSICCMANTTPPVDSSAGVRFIYDRARYAHCWVYPVAAISKGLKGEELAEMFDMAMAGAVGFSDDGRPLSNAQLLRNAMTYAKMFELPLMLHEEDLTLSSGRHMHEGVASGLAGMQAVPSVAESGMIARDVLLAEFLEARIHICHVSAKESVDVVRVAKERGVDVTAEATVHHLLLTDEDVVASGFDSNFKMNPPLRAKDDLAALIEGINDGAIDAIVTDHAPHPPEDKDCEFAVAPFGVIGLETSASLVYDKLVRPGIIDVKKMVELMSYNPARIVDISAGTLSQGANADIAIFDPEHKWTVSGRAMASKSRNTPFEGWELTGKPVWTMVGGEVAFDELSR
ncbi:MAG TPA: dihydroorotase [candidate division Zixibacteria bacterium]|nr:dihydroorotase [candidate division Zixibacteria bacterium]